MLRIFDIYVEVLSKMYFSFSYYDFYIHCEDKNDCEVLNFCAGRPICDIYFYDNSESHCGSPYWIICIILRDLDFFFMFVVYWSNVLKYALADRWLSSFVLIVHVTTYLNLLCLSMLLWSDCIFLVDSFFLMTPVSLSFPRLLALEWKSHPYHQLNHLCNCTSGHSMRKEL